MAKNRRDRGRPFKGGVRLSYYFDRGFQHTKANFFRLVLLFLFLRLPGFVVLLAGYLSLDAQPIAEMSPYDLAWTLTATYIAHFALNSFLAPVGVVVAYRAALQSERNMTWTLRGVLALVAKRFSTVMSVGIAYYGVVNALGLIMAGVSMAFVVAPMLILDEGLVAVLAAQLGAFVVLTMMMVLGVWFLLRYGLALVDAVATEHSYVWDHFSASAQLMRGGYIWAILLTVLLLSIQVGVVSIGVRFVPVPSIAGLEPQDFLSVLPSLLRSQLLQESLGQFISSIVSIYVSTCWALFYLERRAAVHGDGNTAMPAMS
ncbi:MAG: hypothetical protein AAF449_05885 [Myxococcota bacterium]